MVRERVTAMLHVPSVRKAVDWYTEIGFLLVRSFDDPCEEGELSFAVLSFGATEIMLNAGGKPSDAKRREVDLYVHTADVAKVAAEIRGRVDVVEDIHDTFYGMRELIVRDLNGFWITFGEPILQTQETR
jgi:hypothetical protein